MWNKFTDWLSQPFDAEMDTLHWFLFLGLLIVLMAGWRIILTHTLER
jgi:hypothetical protein